MENIRLLFFKHMCSPKLLEITFHICAFLQMCRLDLRLVSNSSGKWDTDNFVVHYDVIAQIPSAHRLNATAKPVGSFDSISRYSFSTRQSVTLLFLL